MHALVPNITRTSKMHGIEGGKREHMFSVTWPYSNQANKQTANEHPSVALALLAPDYVLIRHCSPSLLTKRDLPAKSMRENFPKSLRVVLKLQERPTSHYKH